MTLARRSPLVAVVLALATGCGGSYKAAPQAPSGAAPASDPAGGIAVAAEAAPAEAAPGKAAPRNVATVATPPQKQAPIAATVAGETTAPTGTEHYRDYGKNPFVETKKDRLSTFSIDVDTASYAIARRKLNEGTLPPSAAVRTEEFLNSFDYGYEGPGADAKGRPFSVHMAAAPSPYAKGHHLVRIGVQAKRLTPAERVPAHLVYLVDVSGSMSGPDRIGLAKRSLELLTEKLVPGDTVAICTYAGGVRTVLEPTGIERKDEILRAIRSLSTGGGTAMGSGIQNAYDLASRTLVKGHVNRVVVLSDGDANIGNTSHDQVLATIRRYKDRGITLSTVGYGSGNYKDVMMERLADEGDGNYTYIDSERMARKVFVEQADSLLHVVARDVKIQVELDPSVVARYRLLGYENRDIADKDFRNDKVDAGEVGAGHSVTALYDVELLRTDASPLTVRVRHKPAKNPLHGGSDVATESAYVMPSSAVLRSFDDAPESFRFATAVVGFAEILRRSPHASTYGLADVERIASRAAAGRSERVELLGLVRKAAELSGRPLTNAVAITH